MQTNLRPSAPLADSDTVLAREAGANDYVRKPSTLQCILPASARNCVQKNRDRHGGREMVQPHIHDDEIDDASP
jgi:DNA-binding response OmpR family regulator